MKNTDIKILEMLHNDLLIEMVRSLNAKEKMKAEAVENEKWSTAKRLEADQQATAMWASQLADIWGMQVKVVEICGEVDRKFMLVEKEDVK